MDKEYKDMSSLEIAAFICSELDKINIKTTLSGGFCAEIYSCGEYTSMDIDLINQYNEDHSAIVKKMVDLGFKQEGKFFYRDDVEYGIEFPSGPPSVGNELVKDVAEIETDVGVLRILTPTDAIKDRLCGYFYWSNEPSLEQAVMIALKNQIDFKNLEEWANAEGEIKKYDIFYNKFNEENRKKQDNISQKIKEVVDKKEEEIAPYKIKL
jgi:hypothetical protein